MNRIIDRCLVMAALLAAQGIAHADEIRITGNPHWRPVQDQVWVTDRSRQGQFAVRVAIGDLNLAAPGGAATLRRRVAGGIQRSCAVLAEGMNVEQAHECEGMLRSGFRPRVAAAIGAARVGRAIAFIQLGSSPGR